MEYTEVEIEAKNIARSFTRDFGAFLVEPSFRRFCKQKTSVIRQFADLYFGAGPAACADAAEAFELASSIRSVQHASSPERGRRIY